MKRLVSILIPAFNAEQWIGETLASAVQQTWDRTEIIVVDDGSSDRTVDIARRFESARVRVINQQRQGAAAARNKALSLSQGDYVQWLDADDLLSRDKISLQVEALDQRGQKRTLASCAWGSFMFRHQKAIFAPTVLWSNQTPVEWLVHKLGENLFMQTATWLVSRELTEATGAWNTALLGDDDGEYFARALVQSDGVLFVPGARVYYRDSGPASLSRIGRSDAKAEAHWRSMQLHIRYATSLEGSERVRAACLRYLANSGHYFHPERPHILAEMEKAARSVGGELAIRPLPWKYAWIQRCFGWETAKRARVALPQTRGMFKRRIDYVLNRLEGHKRERIAPFEC